MIFDCFIVTVCVKTKKLKMLSEKGNSSIVRKKVCCFKVCLTKPKGAKTIFIVHPIITAKTILFKKMSLRVLQDTEKTVSTALK